MSAGRKRAAHLLLALSVLMGALAVLLPVFSPAAQAVDASAVTKSVTAVRTFVDRDGNPSVASSNDIRLQVSQTENLRGRQEVHVSWSGAVPTGGVVPDPNSSDGRNQEYPFVLLECRGVDTTGTAPQGQVKLSPETCWTQTSPERYLAAASNTPAWRFDAYAKPADRAAVVGAPDPLPEACARLAQPVTARWLPLRAAGGTTYYGGPDPGAGCTPTAPETDDAEAGGLPSNTTYGVTGTDGTGQTDFAVWTASENASLGCSAEVSCALVAVPIVGVSCDAYGTKLPAGQPQTTKAGVPLTDAQLATADTTCRRTGAYLPGSAKSSTTSDQAVRGALWWSESNWRNRITVPLKFALTGSVCDVVSHDAPQEVLGSVVANELTASWRPRFCTSKDLFTFTHVQQSDSLARTLVDSGEIDAALSSAPKDGGYTRPVVQAPLAVGGFAIAFSVDDASGKRQESLNLDARLVAKLLSSSYPALPVVKDNHPSIGGNPYNITLDPEFQALNPGLPASSNLEAGAALQVFSTSTDLVWALTSWINKDPEARAWLNGYADPWGMKVNENYRGIKLPVDNWPLLDDFVAPESYQSQNACYRNSPTPFMQLIANPASSMSAVLLNMQFASSAVQTICKYDGVDQTTLALKTQGRQTVGYRFVLGLVSVSAAERYNLRTASLQTTSTVAPGTTFDGTAGRTFVKPDVAGLRAGASLLEPDDDAGLWSYDYDALSTDEGARAYPGVLPIYLVVPTQGVEDGSDTKLAKMLCYASKDGQVAGLANGQLPPGYLPITTASGLGAERDYQLSAIAAIRAQDGDVPALDATAPSRAEACDFSRKPVSPSPTPTPTPTDAPSTTAPVVDPTSPALPPTSVSAPPTAAAPSSAAPSESAAPIVDAPTTLTAAQTSAFGRLGTPGLLVLAVLTALLGSLMRWGDLIAAAISTGGPKARAWAKARRRGGS